MVKDVISVVFVMDFSSEKTFVEKVRTFFILSTGKNGECDNIDVVKTN